MRVVGAQSNRGSVFPFHSNDSGGGRDDRLRKTVRPPSTSASARSASARPRRSPRREPAGEGGNGTRLRNPRDGRRVCAGRSTVGVRVLQGLERVRVRCGRRRPRGRAAAGRLEFRIPVWAKSFSDYSAAHCASDCAAHRQVQQICAGTVWPHRRSGHARAEARLGGLWPEAANSARFARRWSFMANRLTRLSGSLRFGASSWSVGSIWGKSGPPDKSRVTAHSLRRTRHARERWRDTHHEHGPSVRATAETMNNEGNNGDPAMHSPATVNIAEPPSE